MSKLRMCLIASVSVVGVCTTTANAAVIGVYSENTQAQSAAGNIVSNQGHAFESLNNLTASSLSGVDVAWYMNQSNGSQAQSNNAAAIENFVSSGGTFLMNDRNVTDADTIVPGSNNFNFVRDTSREIDVEDDSTALTNGAGGVIDDNTLDGGSSSNHGYIDANSIPAGATNILNAGSSNEIVDLTFSVGSGEAHYSTIPLDYYVDDGGGDFANTYAPNLVNYGAGLQAEVPVPAPFALLGTGLIALGIAPIGRRRQA